MLSLQATHNPIGHREILGSSSSLYVAAQYFLFRFRQVMQPLPHVFIPSGLSPPTRDSPPNRDHCRAQEQRSREQKYHPEVGSPLRYKVDEPEHGQPTLGREQYEAGEEKNGEQVPWGELNPLDKLAEIWHVPLIYRNVLSSQHPKLEPCIVIHEEGWNIRAQPSPA